MTSANIQRTKPFYSIAILLTTCNIEVRDSRTGYFIPARYGLGLWPDGKIVGAPSSSSSSASPGNHLEKVTLTVLVFGPEWVSYERSRGMRHTKMREISARVFFVKIPKSQDSMIYTIFSFFRLSNWFVLQYFSVQNWVKLVRVPVFLSSKLIRMMRFPIFT